MTDTIISQFNHFWLELQKTLQHNQFVTGGLTLGIVGGVLAYFRRLPKQVLGFVWRRVIVEVQVDSGDHAFEWFRVWLTNQRMFSKMGDLLLLTRLKGKAGFAVTNIENSRRGVFAPRAGTFRVQFEGRAFWFTIIRQREQTSSGTMGFYENLTIRTLVTNRVTLEGLVRGAYQSMYKPQEPQVEILTPRRGDWCLAQRLALRDPSSLLYANDLFERVYTDTKRFLESGSWYSQMGIPWRRGYLLYGPPGNGKSSLITALAGELKRSVCVLNLADNVLDDETLIYLMADAPDGSLILLEDIDAVFSGRENSKGRVSFNGLLNALDGVTAQNGSMVFMTTNHLEKLDPALIRPGRCDLHLCFDNATRVQVQNMLERFYPGISDAFLLAERITGDTLSMARVQGFLMRFRDDLAGARAAWHELETNPIQESVLPILDGAPSRLEQSA